MRRSWTVLLLSGAFLLVGVVTMAASRASLSTLEEPGGFETWAATRAKRWLVGRAAHSIQPTIPSGDVAVATGEMRFRGECAPCHGADGRSLTDIGRGLYPRAADLGSPRVQAWSDRELFWIVKHGLRLTGIPGFGAVLEDEEIGALVAYVRTLAAGPDLAAE